MANMAEVGGSPVHRPSIWWRSRTALGIAVAAGLVLIASVFAVYLGRVHQRTVEQSSVSYKYGQHLMTDVIYGEPLSGSVREACTALLKSPPSPPANLNRKEALDGCVDEERTLDN